MKFQPLLRALLLGALILPVLSYGQTLSPTQASYKLGGEGTSFTANVPLNEISTHSFRYFHRHFPSVSGENWIKYTGGLTVVYKETSLFYKGFFDRKGGFQYSLTYYPGGELIPTIQSAIKRSNPGFNLDLVTELNNGNHIVYTVQLVNSSFLKTVTFCEGRTETSEELVNAGGATQQDNWAASFTH